MCSRTGPTSMAQRADGFLYKSMQPHRRENASTVQRRHQARPVWLTSPVRPKSPAPEGAPAAAAGDLAEAAADAPPGAAPLQKRETQSFQRQEAQSSCSAAA